LRSLRNIYSEAAGKMLLLQGILPNLSVLTMLSGLLLDQCPANYRHYLVYKEDHRLGKGEGAEGSKACQKEDYSQENLYCDSKGSGGTH
jgi:hypothetical protein